MVTQDQWGAVVSLWRQGHRKKAIAKMMGLHVQTVRKYLAQGCWSPYQLVRSRPSSLDLHRDYLLRRMAEVGFNGKVLLRELRERGYRGGYNQIKRFVAPHREQLRRQEEATMRFETAPGKQAQVDWGTAMVWIGGRQLRVQFFVMVLGFSRRIFAAGTMDQKEPALLKCHEAAFEHFGGRTREILYDNPKTITLRREGDKPVFHPVFEDFARYWGFLVRLCQYYRARTKGKVESGVKYVKRNFLAGKRFESLEHLNRELLGWCVDEADQRIHGTTHRKPAEAFAEEAKALIPTTGHAPYMLIESISRTVARDCLVAYQANRYSVPSRYVGRSVDLVLSEGRLRILHEGRAIAEHEIKAGRFGVVMKREHYADLLVRPPARKPDAAWRPPWPEVEVRPLAAYEEAALAAGGAR